MLFETGYYEGIFALFYMQNVITLAQNVMINSYKTIMAIVA